MQYKGQYTDELLYAPNDVVFVNGSSFVARRMTKGIHPVGNPQSWGLLASGGVNGSNGTDGPPGSAGMNGHGVAPGGSVGQVLAKTSDSDYETGWISITPSSIGASHETHNHDAMSIQGMQEALATRASARHGHSMGDVSGLESALTMKANSVHTHFAESIVGGNLTVDSVDCGSMVVGSTIFSGDSVSSESRMTFRVDSVDVLSMLRDKTFVQNTLCVNALRLKKQTAPESSSAPGVEGDIYWEKDYLYVCVSNNSWKRIPLQDW